ncbi:hypothetical protein I4F81_012464 [Pyropia yezoensis]|uniref:Uncharacterized protein n=1 Tax=Pyropia yezoensis TaxID=2788 RepID=A0ACC3CIG3_PYRYE|nr:hypothetical protein I4F81_012464 [Neopyropia yezoensis]
MSTDIFLSGDDTSVRAVRVAPVVLLGVVDHYMRRAAGKHRVIGTLLGVFHPHDGSVDVTGSFPVPHDENADEIAVDIEYNRTMVDLHRNVSSAHAIVGWYATGTETDGNSVLIHEFYGRECAAPVHLLVNADLAAVATAAAASADAADTSSGAANGSGKTVAGVPSPAAPRAYVSSAYTIGEVALRSEFRPVPVAVTPTTPDKVAMDVLFKNRRRLEAAQVDNIQAGLSRLLDLLTVVGRAVDAVVAGEATGDVAAGRFLAETLALMPRVDSHVFDKLFGDNMRDLLMVTYLCSFAQAQLPIAERLLSVDVKALKQ